MSEPICLAMCCRGAASSTSTLILPRASDSRASDVVNMVKNSVFTVKKHVVVLSRMCDSADGQRTHLQMPHALGLVVGRSILKSSEAGSCFCTVHN